jgi:hypothetical protein
MPNHKIFGEKERERERERKKERKKERANTGSFRFKDLPLPA